MLKVRSLALGALMVVGVAAISEAQASSTPRTSPDRGAHGRDHGDMGKPGGHARMGGRRRDGFGLGRDLNLTEAQRTQIGAIHRKYQPQYQSIRERARPFNEAARTARQKWDSVAFRSNTERARQVLAGAETLRTQETAEIRNVLTADQRTKFDARHKEMSERRAKMKSEGGPRGRAGRARPATSATIS